MESRSLLAKARFSPLRVQRESRSVSCSERPDRCLHHAFLRTANEYVSQSVTVIRIRPRCGRFVGMVRVHIFYQPIGNGRQMPACGSWSADGRYYVFQVTQKVLYTDTTITSLWALSDSGPGTGEQASVPVALTSGPMSFGNASPGRDYKNIWAIGVRPAGEVVEYDWHGRNSSPWREESRPRMSTFRQTEIG